MRLLGIAIATPPRALWKIVGHPRPQEKPDSPPPPDAHGDPSSAFPSPANGKWSSQIRVTTDPGFYEEHPESVELWSPGSPAFAIADTATPPKTSRNLRLLRSSTIFAGDRRITVGSFV
jgi:hypothetical protein